MFIRTKDTIFEVVEEKELVYVVKAKNKQGTYSKSKSQTEIVKQAETIYELCDEFVELGNRPIVISQASVKHGRMSGKTSVICGAIWTKFGLKYVAALTDDGHIELL